MSSEERHFSENGNRKQKAQRRSWCHPWSDPLTSWPHSSPEPHPQTLTCDFAVPPSETECIPLHLNFGNELVTCFAQQKVCEQRLEMCCRGRACLLVLLTSWGEERPQVPAASSAWAPDLTATFHEEPNSSGLALWSKLSSDQATHRCVKKIFSHGVLLHNKSWLLYFGTTYSLNK